VKNARFFVTAVLVLATFGVGISCSGNRDRKQQQAKQVQKGTQKLAEMSAVESDLTKRSLYLTDGLYAVKTMAEQQNWMRFSKADRGLIKESLAQYLALSNEVLGLDAKRGIYLDRKETFDAKREGASMYQKSIENFEKVNGENFEPKPGSSQEILLSGSEARE
jgi:hypothetical protein